jgi:acyl-coenzyme A thioesterase PaaI-like protein
VTDAFFTPLSRDGRRYRGEEACAGPWSEELMHGGPPSALLVRTAERAAADSVSRDAVPGEAVPGEAVAGDAVPGDTVPGLVALRASVDFLSPVPVGVVEVSARVVRRGRRITLTEAVLAAAGREVLHARVWHVRLAERPTPALDPAPAARRPSPDRLQPALESWEFPYARSLEWRLVHGDPVGPGPAAVWSRTRIPVVDGDQPSGLQRAVLTADSGNGLSASLDWNAWSFVNIDLDVHLSRPLVGEWVLLDAATRYEPTGTALAASALADEQGPVGRAAQTLIVTPRASVGQV